MQATLDGHQVAASDDIVEAGGYQYFPASAVRMEWLQKTAKTAQRDIKLARARYKSLFPPHQGLQA